MTCHSETITDTNFISSGENKTLKSNMRFHKILQSTTVQQGHEPCRGFSDEPYPVFSWTTS